MGYLDDLKKAWKLMWCPSKTTGDKLTVVGALKFYYRATLMPVLITIFLTYFGQYAGTIAQTSAFVPLASMLQRSFNAPVALVLASMLLIWIFIPIGFFVNALLYQLVGKNFLNVFKQSYDRSFSALVFGSMPYVLLFWLFLLPVVNIVAFVVLSLWKTIVEVIAFSSQQKVPRSQVVVVMVAFLSLAILAIILLISAFALANGVGGCGVSTPCPVPAIW